MQPAAQFELLQISPRKEVAQHNSLITAKYYMGIVETRIFISMLARINKTDEDFSIISIPTSEVITNFDGDGYKQLKTAAKRLTEFTINIKKFDSDSFDYISIIERVTYTRGDPHLYAKFSQSAKPYILKLVGNFTLAQLQQITKFKNQHSFRIYGLVKMLYNTDRYKTTILDLKTMLLGEEGMSLYKEYKDFRKRILVPVIKELADSDCPVILEEHKTGRAFTHLTFIVNRDKKVEPELVIPENIVQRLLSLDINLKVINRINESLINNEFDVNYITYVVNIMTDKYKNNKIKRLAGAIVAAIIEKYLLDDYKKDQSSRVYKAPKKQAVETKEKIMYFHQSLLKMYELAKKSNRTTSSFEGWVDQVYLQNGFERVQQADTWYVWKEK